MNIKLRCAISIVLLSIILASCSSKGRTVSEETGLDTMGSDKQGTTTSSSSTSSKGGGYYLDDGPGSNPPPNIDAIPDAVPRQETMLTSTSRPYKVLGKVYKPMTKARPYKVRGIASWYGRRYHGRKTASGEIYDMYQMSAAHTTLPIPSYVRVTNLENKRSVVVRINDRGPFIANRLIDLSYAAAYKLRLIGKGRGMVEVEAIDPNNYSVASKTTSPAKKLYAPPSNSKKAVYDRVSPSNLPKNTNDQSNAKASKLGKIYVQVGAFRQKANADKLLKKITRSSVGQNEPTENWYNGSVYRVRLGPYASRNQAERMVEKIRQALELTAIITD